MSPTVTWRHHDVMWLSWDAITKHPLLCPNFTGRFNNDQKWLLKGFLLDKLIVQVHMDGLIKTGPLQTKRSLKVDVSLEWTVIWIKLVEPNIGMSWTDSWKTYPIVNLRIFVDEFTNTAHAQEIVIKKKMDEFSRNRSSSSPGKLKFRKNY